MKSFKKFIEEANYGALQTDRRIRRIRDELIARLKRKWEMERTVRVSVESDLFIDDGSTRLKIVPREADEIHPDSVIFLGGMTGTMTHGYNTIIIYIRSTVGYETAIKRINEIKPLLSHEVKHVIDNLDNRYGKNSMSSYLQYDGDNYKKYVTQIQEISNFLITVIEDLDLIRNKNKDISFGDALKQSFWWNHILETALYDYGKLNKFKSKLAQFWNHEQVITGRIDRGKELRLQLMLLLYQWHKEGDVKKIRDMGKSPVDVLSRNIERMDNDELRQQIAKFSKLLDERGR